MYFFSKSVILPPEDMTKAKLCPEFKTCQHAISESEKLNFIFVTCPKILNLLSIFNHSNYGTALSNICLHFLEALPSERIHSVY